jgi:hypothetical protein
VLRAAIRGSDLSVWADGVLAWQGSLGDDARDLDGPVGLRSDNARFTFSLLAGGGASSRVALSCRESNPEGE